MKSKIKKNIAIRATAYTLPLLIFICSACNEDGPSVFIKIQQPQVSFLQVNTCHAGGGVYYTEFDFIVPYQTSSPNIKIEKVIYSIAVGSSVTEKEDFSFDDSGTAITYSLCIRFTGAPRVDYTSTLVSTDGIKSNTGKVRIDKPAGAN